MAVIPDTHNTGLTPTQIDTAFSNALTHTPSDSTPKEDGSGSAGEAETFARSDHEHPHDTTKQDTLAFEGTYNASTNKAATMSAVKDGKLTGYAQLSGNVAATDKIVEAIGKVEKKADDNKTNILSVINGWETKSAFNGSNPTVSTIFDTTISTITARVNRALRRVVLDINLTAKSAYTSSASVGIISLASMSNYTELIPPVTAYKLLQSSTYSISITKNNSNDIGALTIISGGITVNDNIQCQFEYTY